MLIKTKRNFILPVVILSCLLFLFLNNFSSLVKADSSDTEGIYLAARQNILSLMDSEEEAVYGNEWLALDLVRDGQEIPAFYLQNVIDTIVANDGTLHTYAGDYTNYAKIILALTALGVDATDVAGYNMIEPISDFSTVEEQGINGIVYALIALDSHDYEIQPPASSSEAVTRDTYINSILNSQLEDGGWDWMEKQADPDMTAMAIQSLAPYYESDERVKNAVDTAFQTLSVMQQPDGGFRTEDAAFEESSESTAMVILALTSLGIDPDSDSRFIKNGNTTIDNLCSFAVPEGGFKHTKDGSYDILATDQGYRALASYFRLKDGRTSLYDMSDITKLKTVDIVSEKEIESTPKPSLWIFLIIVVVVALGIVTSILIHNRRKNKGEKQ